MDFYKVPIGFGMAMAVNEPAMNAYSAMTEAQKQDILNRAHNVRSEREKHEVDRWWFFSYKKSRFGNLPNRVRFY